MTETSPYKQILEHINNMLLINRVGLDDARADGENELAKSIEAVMSRYIQLRERLNSNEVPKHEGYTVSKILVNLSSPYYEVLLTPNGSDVRYWGFANDLDGAFDHALRMPGAIA